MKLVNVSIAFFLIACSAFADHAATGGATEMQICQTGSLVRSDQFNMSVPRSVIDQNLTDRAQHYCYIHGLGLNFPKQLSETAYTPEDNGQSRLIKAEACFACLDQ